MLHISVAQIIELISAHVQLMPGDWVLTGSPAGALMREVSAQMC